MLVRKETNPDDLEGMIAARGILTARGGKTSHAAVVARGMGRTCVCGAEALDVDAAAKVARIGSTVINEGDSISIDGSTGEVFLGEMAVVPSPVETYIEKGLEAVLDGVNDEAAALSARWIGLLTHADARRWLLVRANADTAEDAVRARSLGAQGSMPPVRADAAGWLCRTEHMFLGDRRSLIERLILAVTPAERTAALDALLPLQRADFVYPSPGAGPGPRPRPGWERSLGLGGRRNDGGHPTPPGPPGRHPDCRTVPRDVAQND
jgi:pyruvate,orthophosphate dikinase